MTFQEAMNQLGDARSKAEVKRLVKRAKQALNADDYMSFAQAAAMRVDHL
jgi:hypothetical protein